MIVDLKSGRELAPAEAAAGHNKPPLPERLALDYADFVSEAEQLAERANALPKTITSDEELGATGAVVKDARDLFKRVEDTRVEEKEPYLTGGKQVDAFFKPHIDRCERIIKSLEDRGGIFQREKAEKARRAAAEASRIAQAEAARQAEIARRAEEAGRAKTAAKAEEKSEALQRQAEDAEVVAQASTNDLSRTVTATGITATAKEEWTFEITDLNQIPLDSLRAFFGVDVIEKALRQYVRKNKGSAPLNGVRFFQQTKANFK